MAFVYLSDLLGAADPREAAWTNDLVSVLKGQPGGMGDLSGAKSQRLFMFAKSQNEAIQKALDAGDQAAAVKAACVNPWSTSCSEQKVQDIIANPDANKAILQRISNQAAASGFTSLPQVVPAAAVIPPQAGVPLPGGGSVPSSGMPGTAATGAPTAPGGPMGIPGGPAGAPGSLGPEGYSEPDQGGASTTFLIGLGVVGLLGLGAFIYIRRQSRDAKKAAEAAAARPRAVTAAPAAPKTAAAA